MYLICASYMQLVSFIYHFLLQKQPCLRRWNHSSMSLFWNAIVLTGDPPAQSSCKFWYLSCEKRGTLRSTRQSTKQFDLPSLAKSCEKREMLCSTRRCWSTRIHTNWTEMMFFIWLNLNWPRFIDSWWWELDIQGLHWDGIKLCKQ